MGLRWGFGCAVVVEVFRVCVEMVRVGRGGWDGVGWDGFSMAMRQVLVGLELKLTVDLVDSREVIGEARIIVISPGPSVTFVYIYVT